jgi:hypothetical protein
MRRGARRRRRRKVGRDGVCSSLVAFFWDGKNRRPGVEVRGDENTLLWRENTVGIRLNEIFMHMVMSLTGTS